MGQFTNFCCGVNPSRKFPLQAAAVWSVRSSSQRLNCSASRCAFCFTAWFTVAALQLIDCTKSKDCCKRAACERENNETSWPSRSRPHVFLIKSSLQAHSSQATSNSVITATSNCTIDRPWNEPALHVRLNFKLDSVTLHSSGEEREKRKSSISKHSFAGKALRWHCAMWLMQFSEWSFQTAFVALQSRVIYAGKLKRFGAFKSNFRKLHDSTWRSQIKFQLASFMSEHENRFLSKVLIYCLSLCEGSTSESNWQLGLRARRNVILEKAQARWLFQVNGWLNWG